MAEQQLKPLLSTAKLIKMSWNPMGMLEMASANNPALQEVYNQASAMNGNPKSAFMQAAKAKGYSDEEINNYIQKLQQLWNTL